MNLRQSMGVIKIKIRIKIRIIVKTRIVLKGGGNDHEWMGVTEWTPWVALPISLDGVRPGEQVKPARYVRLTESI